MSSKLLQVFNRYKDKGGEEKSVDRIYSHASEMFEVDRYIRSSEQWLGDQAPGKAVQLRNFFYNKQTNSDLKKLNDTANYDALILHNIYPVISPSVYHFCLKNELPIVQFIHNFRPFSVGGSCWTGAEICEAGLRKSFLPEVKAKAWQESYVKSAAFALMLKRLHSSGWLDCVTRWVAISDFMAAAFVKAGIPAEKVITLRHSWDAMPEPIERQDQGYYLLLARLVPEKGVLEAMRSWKHLGKTAPKLIVCGTGPLEAEVEAMADGEFIEYRGFVDGETKRELIIGCRAMLAPSIWWEPLGLVTYEAYDYSKPMIAAASGGLSETVVHGVTGLLYNTASNNDLVTTVKLMESMSPLERCSMGEAGRAWLLEHASPDRWKRDFKAIIESLTRMNAVSTQSHLK